MSSRQIDFESLIAPISRQRFLDEHWEKKHLHVPHGEANAGGTILDFAAVDRCLAAARNSSRRDAVMIVPPPDREEERKTRAAGAVLAHDLYQAFAAGDSLRLSGIQAYWPEATAVAAELAEVFSASVGVNAYVTPAASQAFPAHFDTHDVFVVQTDGSKRWTIYAGGGGLPTESLAHVQDLTSRQATRLDESQATVIDELTLESGDFLYIPRGVPHKAIATDQPSLHLTFGVRPVLWFELLRRALDLAATEQVELRRALPPGFASNPESKPALRERFTELARLAFESLDFKRAINSLEVEVVAGHDYPPDGHFASLLALPSLGAETPLERRRGLDCLVEVGETAARIRFASNEVRGPASIGPALRFVRDTRRFTARELPGPLSEESKVVLARKLIHAGLLRIESSTGSSADQGTSSA